jgi:hypothetical protein
MAAKLPSLFKVNLLIHKGEQEKIITKLIRWALSSGRFIVIVVEIITISAFVYRYKLDADLNDLQEQINEKIPYIKSLSADENKIKLTQFQISEISKLKSERVDFAIPLTEISKIIPKNIQLTTINFDRAQAYPETSLSIIGQTPSNLELAYFIKELQSDPMFTNIALSNISFDNQITFTIIGNLASNLGKNK